MKKITYPAILEITEKYNEKMRERTDRRRKLVIFEEGDHLAVKEVVVGKKTDAKWTTGRLKGSLISPRVEERPTSTRFDGRVMIRNTTPGSR